MSERTDPADPRPAAAFDAPPPRLRSAVGGLTSNQAGLALVTILFVLLFNGLTPGFGSPFNLYALGRVVAIDVVIGFSMMVVLATGGMNLAVGSIGVCAAMAAGWAMQQAGLPIPIAVLAGIAMGAALGTVNGLGIVLTGVNSFIITLATMSLFFGAMILMTEAEAFRSLPQAFVDLGKIRVFGFVSGLVFVALAVAAGLLWLYRFTRFGREVLALGANMEAARLSGIRVERVLVASHALSGALAGLAGLMLTARNGAALPSMTGHIGMDWLLPAFLAPVLGGTLLSGGTISVVGALLGAVMVGVIANGLLLLQVSDFWVQLFMGLILLVAVMLDRARSVFALRRRMGS